MVLTSFKLRFSNQNNEIYKLTNFLYKNKQIFTFSFYR